MCLLRRMQTKRARAQMATELFWACCGAARFMMTGWPDAACCFATWSAKGPPVTDVTGKATTGMLISAPEGTVCTGLGPPARFFARQ